MAIEFHAWRLAFPLVEVLSGIAKRIFQACLLRYRESPDSLNQFENV